jgi:hypothetical protein
MVAHINFPKLARMWAEPSQLAPQSSSPNIGSALLDA